MGRVGWFMGAVGAVLAIGLLVLIVIGAPEGDGSIFVYVADGLLKGDQPYVDRWDHKGPAIYLVNAAGLLLTPGSWAGIHVLEIGSLVACGLLGFATLRPAFGRAASLVAMVVAGLTVAALVAPGNYTEEWALLPQFLALLLFSRVASAGAVGRREAFGLLAIGALGAIAFMYRPNLVGVWLAIGAYWLMFGRSRMKRLALATVGGSAVLILGVAALASAGSWGAFVEAVFTYNGAYSDELDLRSWLTGLSSLLDPSSQTSEGWRVAAAVGLAWVPVAIASVRPGEAGSRETALVRWAAVAVPIEMLLLSVSGRAYTHYFLALVPVLSVLTAFVARHVIEYFGQPAARGLNTEGDSRQPNARTGWTLAAVALGTAWLTLAIINPVPSAIGAARPYELRLHEAAADHVAAEVAPGETVLIWSGEPLVLLLAERESASRFFYQLPLVTPGYTTDELVASFVDELEQTAPALIIDTRNKSLPPLDSVERNGFTPPDEYDVDPGHLDPVFAFVESGYERGPEIGPWATYRRR